MALFAPCCIVFLLPSYLAASVKNRRWRLLPLTLVFALGLALVLVPVTLGVSLLAAALAKYHTGCARPAAYSCWASPPSRCRGAPWSLPRLVHAPTPNAETPPGCSALGVFSAWPPRAVHRCSPGS